MVQRFMNNAYARLKEQETPEAKTAHWDAAKGLQAVDGLRTTPYLEEIAESHIAGRYTSSDATRLVQSYYEKRATHGESMEGREPDLVSARIVELLESRAFSYRPTMLNFIHEKLFKGLIDHPYDAEFRDYNITKKEFILAGETVVYADYGLIPDNLSYDFKAFDYSGFFLAGPESAKQFDSFITFISNIWQTHPFVEGNTRTVAVFAELMLRAKGANINNDAFAEHSLFFRNALIRANYSSLAHGLPEDKSYLKLFFENLLLGTEHQLKNRALCCDECFVAQGLELPPREFEKNGHGPQQ